MSSSTQLLCRAAIAVLWLSSFRLAEPPSHDVVYYASGESVYCEVIEVTDTTVRYRMSDTPDGEVYNDLRDDIALIVKRDGKFLLPAEPGTQWKAGADPDFDNILTADSQVLPASDIQEHDDIIYYQDALESTDASVLTDETMAIIYRDGSHRLFADINDVVLALSGAIDFAVPADSADAVASTEPSSGPDSEEETDNNETVAEEGIRTEDEPAMVAEATNEVPEGPKEELELTEADYEKYAAKAKNKAEYLSNYLGLLCNRELDSYDKEQAVESALKLFVHDSTRVQVSSLNRDEIVTYFIGAYLDHLSRMNYEKVELLWRNVQYITKFRLAPDGNYYGTISVEQVFRGFQDGQAVYADITQKDMEIALGNFKREESGVTKYVWDVFLSDIGVQETRKLYANE